MMDEATLKKHVRLYVRVFLALAILTLLTVTFAFLPLPFFLALLFALLIASIKGGLVAGFFMHLAFERKIIYWLLGLTFFLFLFVLIVPAIS